MSSLIHIIYTSAATVDFQDHDLTELLQKARATNTRLGITGMLLFENGSFFQILEGSPLAVDALFHTIEQDHRHKNVVAIIREPIIQRAFAEWTMGYAKITQGDASEIMGQNDFFGQGSVFQQVNAGRAKKLLNVFREGRWRSKVSFSAPVIPLSPATESINQPKISFAFQPIIDTSESKIVAYEAIIATQNAASLLEMPVDANAQEWAQFETAHQAKALQIASKLGLDCDIFLKFKTYRIDAARESLASILEEAKRLGIPENKIIFEIDHDAMVGDLDKFSKILEDFRGAGLKISIDHFGAGKAALSLLESLNPHMVSLTAQLIRDIHSNGSRQAIVRGVLQTCTDLGIDLIAKSIESEAEYRWLCEEGIQLLQGNFIAAPVCEQLPPAKFLKV